MAARCRGRGEVLERSPQAAEIMDQRELRAKMRMRAALESKEAFASFRKLLRRQYGTLFRAWVAIDTDHNWTLTKAEAGRTAAWHAPPAAWGGARRLACCQALHAMQVGIALLKLGRQLFVVCAASWLEVFQSCRRVAYEGAVRALWRVPRSASPRVRSAI